MKKINGDIYQIGDAATTSGKEIQANNGGAVLPSLFYNPISQRWLITNDGINFFQAYQPSYAPAIKFDSNGGKVQVYPMQGKNLFSNVLEGSFIYQASQLDSVSLAIRVGGTGTYVTPNTYANFQAWAEGTIALDNTNSDGNVAIPTTATLYELQISVEYDAAFAEDIAFVIINYTKLLS